jgi:NAD-dependent dihydropyrimidine dehydrogenase PreA subunit
MKRCTIVVSRPERPDAGAAALLRGVIERCRAGRVAYRLIPPLYHIAESSAAWQGLADELDGAVLLCWLPPRPAHWLLRRHHIDCPERRILDLRDFSDAESVWTAAVAAAPSASRRHAGQPADPPPKKPYRAAAKPRWYPVVDGSRCVQCGHCLQFCLFGVYALDADGKVVVENPDRCKPGCPACARICPHSAIMFPLYEDDPAIAGAPGQLVVLDAAAQEMVAARGRQSERPAFDDLDALVDQLDRAMQRRG